MTGFVAANISALLTSDMAYQQVTYYKHNLQAAQPWKASGNRGWYIIILRLFEGAAILLGTEVMFTMGAAA